MSDLTYQHMAPSDRSGADDPARQLSKLWRRGQQPRVEDFLAQAGVTDPAVIVTVLRVDQWERRRRGQWVPAESYLEAFPAVRGDPERAIDVVFAEYLLREHHGESPTLSEYTRRFPQYADPLRLQVELHGAIGGEGERDWPATWDQGRANPRGDRGTESEAGSEPGLDEHPNIHGYEILGVLGWGGMGVVYRAWQHRLNRMVALKLVRAGAHASPQVLARVRVEAEAVARLQHPNIVQIHQVGQHAGCPFLVLELVDGPSLAQSLASTPQATPRAVELVELLARAIHSAHGQGVVHRDLTPANILLTADGVPKITDFGLAKIVIGGEGLRTQTGELLGTPSYMAPEQAASRHEAIGAATDVYALGAILYEMLTGRPPFKAESPLETIRQVVADEPVAPSRLRPKLPRDLETICLKCLRKEPAQRYASAAALADDLRRFLDGRPILARRSGAAERAWRWCRRNPGLATACTTAAAAVVTLAFVSTVMAATFWVQRDEIADQRDQVRQAETHTRGSLVKARAAQARATRLGRQAGQRHGGLGAIREATRIALSLNWPPERLAELRDEAIACLALPDVVPTDLVFHRPPGVVLSAFDPTMMRYAHRFRDGTIRAWRIADDEPIATFKARGDREILIFKFSPDGRYLATTHYPNSSLTIWDVDRGSVLLDDAGRVSGRSAAFRPDSRQFALAHEDGEILLYDLEGGRLPRSWRGPAPGGPRDLVFRPDGIQIAITSQASAPTCWILETETGRLVRSISLPSRGELAWSPDGTTLATACDDRKIYLWEAATGIRKAVLDGHLTGGMRAVFHPAGTLLASVDWGNWLWLWDPILGRLLMRMSGTAQPEFSRDGQIVVELGDELTAYRVDPAPEYRTFTHGAAELSDYLRASIRRDGRVLAVGTSRGVALWDLARGTELGVLRIGGAQHVLFEASGELLTSGSVGMQRWPIQLDLERGDFRIGPPRRLRSFPSGDSGIAEDASGRVVALAGHGVAYVQTPDRSFRVGPLDDARSVAVSPDGQWLVTGSFGHNGAHVWRVRDCALVKRVAIEGMVELLFSPDGNWLMEQNPPCRLWDARTWRESWRIDGDGFGFSPDGRLMAVQDAGKALRLVETETGRTLARLESPDMCKVRWATFSPDGSRLVVTTNDGPAVHVWDLRAIRRELVELGLDWDAPAYPIDDPCGPEVTPLPPLQVNYGELESHLQHQNESPATLIDRYTARLEDERNNADAYHHRAHALINLGRLPEAIEDLARAIRLRPDDVHYRTMRGEIYYRGLWQFEAAIPDLEASLSLRPDSPVVREWLAICYNNRAWELTDGPEARRRLDRALELCRRAVALTPGEGTFLNTLGVIQYRSGRYDEAIATLERSLAAGNGRFDGFDLFFLAMAHHRLGHREVARTCFDRGLRWLADQQGLDKRDTKELADFRAEAEKVLAGPRGELPDDVFAR
jgi:WD40 repeat protein/Tfp pilus assembly protein PilF